MLSPPWLDGNNALPPKLHCAKLASFPMATRQVTLQFYLILRGRHGIRASACRWFFNSLDDIPPETIQVFSDFLTDFGSNPENKQERSLKLLFHKLDAALTLAESKNPAPEDVVGAVFDNLNHADPTVRSTAYRCLEWMLGENCIPNNVLKRTVSAALQSMQVDPEGDVDIPGAEYYDPPSTIAAPLHALIQQTNAPDASERVLALKSISELSSDEQYLGEEILTTLKDPDMSVRVAAARTLGCITCGSLNVAWALQVALSDPCHQVAKTAEMSLRCVIVEMVAMLGRKNRCQ